MSESTSSNNIHFFEMNYDVDEILKDSKSSKGLEEFPDDNLRYQGGLQELR